MFKPGDKVKCIRGHGSLLIQGKVYTVISSNAIHTTLKETPNSWYLDRFVLLSGIVRNLPDWW